MRAGLRELLAAAFVTPAPRPVVPPAASGQPRFALLAVATLIGAWLFAYKVRDFIGLGTTSDLYTFIQMSTTWADRGFFHDNYWGNALTVHSFLFSPVLWPLARPFGAYGLFIALALAMAFSMVAMERILRHFGLPARWALTFAVVATVMPLSAQTYQNVVYGFHPEQLEAVFALWLACHLFNRAWSWALLNAIALTLLKEDAPLLVVAVATTVVIEDWGRKWLAREPRPTASAWNWPALGVWVLGVLAIPVLLYVISTQQPPGAPSNLSRLQPSGRTAAFGNYRELIHFVADNVDRWLSSGAVTDWRNLILPATLGLGILRPHLIAIGLVTTAVAWLRNDNLLWPPRFVQSLALFQIVGCLGFVSVWRLAGAWRAAPRGWPAALALLGVGVSGWALRAQFKTVPHVAAFYQLSPKQEVAPADRERADRLFAVYRNEGGREEPVIATRFLFRYAHDRNLFWAGELKGRPVPTWILWDTEDTPVMGLWTLLKRDAGTDLGDYELRGREGRFVLLKRRSGPHSAPTLETGIPPITGDPSGAIRLRVKLPARQVGHTEPLLSLGNRERGEVFQVSYESANRIVLGVERIGREIFRSAPIDCDPTVEHEIELFSGGLYLPKTENEAPAARSRRAYYEELIRIAINGREVLRKATSPGIGRMDGVTIGINQAQAGSTEPAFTGSIRIAQRGGYPAMPGTADADFGSVRMRLVLPAATAGTPEPLLVMGEPGAAILAYVRVLPGRKIKLGTEVWGVGAFESDEIAADSRQPIEVALTWPGMFPPIGDARWGSIPAARQEQAWSAFTLRIGDKTVLTQPLRKRNWPNTELAFGTNPIGGSLVGGAFTGEILWVLREPLTSP